MNRNLSETSQHGEKSFRGVVTGTRSNRPEATEIADFVDEARLVYVERNDRSLVSIMQDEGVSMVVVWEEEGPVLYHGEERFFYHPGMGKNRITRLRRGESDPLLRALDVEPGGKILDCTLGLASDALLVAYATGPTGRVLGLESSPIITAIVRWGIKKYAKGPVWLKEAMERIEVLHIEHQEFLRLQADKSFDVVYFDPMFRHPVAESAGISPLRSLANPAPLALETIAQARRVARCRVVMKERYGSEEFSRLGFTSVKSGNKSEICYGIIECGD